MHFCRRFLAKTLKLFKKQGDFSYFLRAWNLATLVLGACLDGPQSKLDFLEDWYGCRSRVTMLGPIAGNL